MHRRRPGTGGRLPPRTHIRHASPRHSPPPRGASPSGARALAARGSGHDSARGAEDPLHALRGVSILAPCPRVPFGKRGYADRVTTAAAFPPTRDELEGDDALETLRRTGRRRLLLGLRSPASGRRTASATRARSPSSSTLTLLPALIALVGLRRGPRPGGLHRASCGTRSATSPRARPATSSPTRSSRADRARHESGETALVAGGLAALARGHHGDGAGRARREPALRRRARPAVRSASTATALALARTAGAARAAVGGGARGRRRRSATRSSWGETFDAVWSDRALAARRSPSPSPRWRCSSSARRAAASPSRRGSRSAPPPSTCCGWSSWASSPLYVEATGSFGATYGPIAGTIGVLLWTFLSAVALFLGLALAAQLEAVRAGVPEPRIEPQAPGARAETSRL